MNKRRWFWLISTIGSVGFILVFFGNGCGGEFVPKAGTTNESNSVVAGGTDEEPLIPGAKTVSLVYSNQILEHLTACAGVQRASDSTTQMYDQKKGAVSVYGAANTITSPMMMAVTSIAGEVCNDLINQEMTLGLRIFKNIDLNASALPSDAALKDAISRMALSCWNRRDENLEQQALLDMVYGSVTATEAQAGRKASLMICTSMLSSLDALTN